MQHNRIKKPQLAGGNQLAIYKSGQGFELRTTKNKFSKWPEQDSNQGPPDCKSDAQTTKKEKEKYFISDDFLRNLPKRA